MVFTLHQCNRTFKGCTLHKNISAPNENYSLILIKSINWHWINHFSCCHPAFALFTIHFFNNNVSESFGFMLHPVKLFYKPLSCARQGQCAVTTLFRAPIYLTHLISTVAIFYSSILYPAAYLRYLSTHLRHGAPPEPQKLIFKIRLVHS